MITIIANWEQAQMPPTVEYQLWRQLKGAFKVQRIMYVPITPGMDDYHLEQHATMEDALAAAGDGERVFLEPTGTKGMLDIPSGDIVLITGNTDANNLAYAEAGETYEIKSPQRTALYPTEAAAIALAIRHGQ
jgi:hypothetical protein